jgi:hypothetical protein
MFDYPFIYQWYGYGTIWFGLSLFGNVLTLVALIYYQLTKGSKDSPPSLKETVYQLIYNNTSSFVLLLVLIFNLVWFLICYCLVNLGLALQNDNDLQIFYVFIWLPIPVDGFIYVWLFDKGIKFVLIPSWSYQKGWKSYYGEIQQIEKNVKYVNSIKNYFVCLLHGIVQKGQWSVSR